MLNKTINSLTEYVEEIKQVSYKLIKNGANQNETLLFRGQSNTDFELLPSIARNRRGACSITIFNEERNLIELAKYKLPDVFRNDLLPLEMLALLQHHGIPTRLLDVTENALVALYFACCDNSDKDGEVFCFKNNEQEVASYPIVQAFADSYRLARGTSYPLDLFFEAAIKQPYFLEQKLSCEICHGDNKESGADWVEQCSSELQFVFAPIRSVRQQVQQGRYILFANKIKKIGTKKYFTSFIEPIPKKHEMIYKVVKIPKEVKRQILIDLELFGITKEFLFCDNIDIICNGIKEKLEKKITSDFLH